ncbi:SpoIIE family protein phosphatase [Imhoffiella purpurea]|uniref:Serine phosphatase RsbU, regulator of sigma subunit n=1 Tax=Imhoffiella purpurea TaxID=1249627 RepID=W9V7W4_9GAMM|nr:SpoIIE family protein phosphatase [Imhoffiella purpurea]EXJ15673.1 Serine phosphatase RsbU, regulator of sigma subunit [Imhoffiella purpurea]
MPHWGGIGRRLLIVVMLCVTVVLSASLGFYHHQARQRLMRPVQANADHLSFALVQRVGQFLVTARRATETLAQAIESGRFDEAELEELLRRSLLTSPELFGVGLALDPAGLGDASQRSMMYFHRQADGIRFTTELDEDDYLVEDWYQIPYALQEPEWSEPYYEDLAGRSQLIATFSLPIADTAHHPDRPLGILAADIDLDWLTRQVAKVAVLDTGFAVLISRNGTILTHPDADLIMNESLFSLAELSEDPELQRAQAHQLLSGGQGFIEHSPLLGVMAHIHYAPIAASDWTLAIVFPESELFGDIDRLTLSAAGIGLIGLLVSLIAMALVARSISRPLRALVHSTGRIAQGDFEAPLPEPSHADEVADLTRSFAAMRIALRRHLEQLQRATAARERIESELAIAHDMQMSILPKRLPPIPGHEGVRLEARILPAREVGGDFYDFFLVDPNRLCLLIADVSGKGVPAALFMAMTKTLIKGSARYGSDPGEILSLVNDELAADNDSNMFVTVFCGILDLETGTLAYTNAGHNPPVLMRGAGEDPVLVRSAPQLMLGVMEGLTLRTDRLTLAPGDRLFLYTDGVTEAMNGRDECYSEARLLDLLSGLRTRPIDALGGTVLEDIRDFVGETPQSDDITILICEC